MSYKFIKIGMKVSDLRNISKKHRYIVECPSHKVSILIELYRFVNESNTCQMYIEIVHQTHIECISKTSHIRNVY